MVEDELIKEDVMAENKEETMKRASFHEMRDGTAEDWAIILPREDAYAEKLPYRILETLRESATIDPGYRLNRLEHMLQTAYLAEQDGASDEMVLTALLHDIGDYIGSHSHGAVAAAILSPFVSEECVWVARYHPIFQYKYYGEHVGVDPDLRESYRGHEHFESCAKFCEDWDQKAFSTDLPIPPLSHYEPLIHRMMSKPRWSE